jgi:prophage tail gpP-like protein
VSDEIILKVGGRKFAGWKSARVSRTIEALAGGFELTATDAWGDHPDRFKLAPGASAVIEVGGEAVLTGYIDEVSPKLSAGERSLSIKGRCKTGDLVDCSAVAKTYKAQTLAALANAIAKGYGVSFSYMGADTAIESFSVGAGEKIFAAIERAARARGVLLLSTGAGNVIIAAPSSVALPVRLLEGVNILGGAASFSCGERYATYEVVGNGPGGWGGEVPAPQTATDAGARSPRKLVIVEDGLPLDLSKKRAQWEASTRATRGTKIQVQVLGWRNDIGSLWAPNYLVPVVSDSLGVDGKFLISGVTFSISEQGTTTTLDLRPREGFAVKPEIPKAEEGVKWTQ